MKPVISIITVCYNSENTISKTIESVLRQDLNKMEYLVVDGISTDSTLEIVSSYKPFFQGKMTVVSERDKGWYDAMNKGVDLAKGKFLLFLNSDDYLEKGIIQKVINFIEKYEIESSDIIYGNSTNVYLNKQDQKIFRYIEAPHSFDKNHCKGISDGMCGIRHQSMFVGRLVYDIVGKLDLRYRLHADWDFMIKTLKKNVKYHYIDENISYYSMYGQSTKSTYLERHIVRKENKLYRIIDLKLVNDLFGPKRVIQLILGAEMWNELLCEYHIKHNNAYLEK